MSEINEGKTPRQQGVSNDFFGLNRPQYASTPEVFLSSLAWRSVGATSGKAPVGSGDGAHQGVVYARVTRPTKGNREIRETAPRDGDQNWEMLVSALGQEFQFEGDSSASRAASVLVDDLIGNVPARAQSKAVMPLNLVTALMQDIPGMMGVANPPNFGSILERMYQLGGGDGSAADRLLRAYGAMAGSHDGRDSWFDDATRAMAPTEIKRFVDEKSEVNSSTADHHRVSPLWLEDGNTPFHWFTKAWNNLTAGHWACQMPRRRWVDWASCVLRTAIGLGFLFEMDFYYRLVLALNRSEPEDEEARRLIGLGETFLTWDGFSSVSSRDIAGHIRTTCERGTACRKLLVETWGSYASCPIPPAEVYANDRAGLSLWLRDARQWFRDETDREEKELERRQALTSAGVGRASNNVYETVAYTLLDRGTQGISEDLYSLFKKRGRRYTIIEPGQEWLVVVASLCATDAGGMSRLSDVVSAVESLGVKVGLKTLTRELERTGLARASHDADDAIEVVAAF
ncbi:hypothetical protein [Spiribacter roseus]|uniref:hypothetical protein n=1 Tax=Spiribacter roseus TaxID=1855875 RepID=UPI00132F9086|nr:hypothetical protein [Spiribacter roseus]